MSSTPQSLLPIVFRARPKWANALSYVLTGCSYLVLWSMLIDGFFASYGGIVGLRLQFLKLPGPFDGMKYSFFLLFVLLLGVRLGLQQIVRSEMNACSPLENNFSWFGIVLFWCQAGHFSFLNLGLLYCSTIYIIFSTYCCHWNRLRVDPAEFLYGLFWDSEDFEHIAIEVAPSGFFCKFSNYLWSHRRAIAKWFQGMNILNLVLFTAVVFRFAATKSISTFSTCALIILTTAIFVYCCSLLPSTLLISCHFIALRRDPSTGFRCTQVKRRHVLPSNFVLHGFLLLSMHSLLAFVVVMGSLVFPSQTLLRAKVDVSDAIPVFIRPFFVLTFPVVFNLYRKADARKPAFWLSGMHAALLPEKVSCTRGCLLKSCRPNLYYSPSFYSAYTHCLPSKA